MYEHIQVHVCIVFGVCHLTILPPIKKLENFYTRCPPSAPLASSHLQILQPTRKVDFFLAKIRLNAISFHESLTYNLKDLCN